MTDSVIVAAISALAPTLAVILSARKSKQRGDDREERYDDKMQMHADQLNENAASIAQVHVLVNGRLEDALRRVARLEEALGLQPGEALPLVPLVEDVLKLGDEKEKP